MELWHQCDEGLILMIMIRKKPFSADVFLLFSCPCCHICYYALDSILISCIYRIRLIFTNETPTVMCVCVHADMEATEEQRRQLEEQVERLLSGQGSEVTWCDLGLEQSKPASLRKTVTYIVCAVIFNEKVTPPSVRRFVVQLMWSL